MTSDTPRCEPPEELRGRDGWHWVGHENGETPLLATWENPEWWPDTGGAWRIGSWLYMPEPTHKKGFRYIAPVATPAEVDALRAERDRALVDWHNLRDEVARLRAVADAAREWRDWEIDHSQSMVSRNSLWDAVDDALAALSQPEAKE
jgi:hypothetical protein